MMLIRSVFRRINKCACITKKVHMIMNEWPFFILYSVENNYSKFKGGI